MTFFHSGYHTNNRPKDRESDTKNRRGRIWRGLIKIQAMIVTSFFVVMNRQTDGQPNNFILKEN